MHNGKRLTKQARILFAALIHFLAVHTASAYVGPGAGFALLGSLAGLLLALLLLAVLVLIWPVVWLVTYRARRHRSRSQPFRRVLLLCVEGVPAGQTDRSLAAEAGGSLARIVSEGGLARCEPMLFQQREAVWASMVTGRGPGQAAPLAFGPEWAQPPCRNAEPPSSPPRRALWDRLGSAGIAVHGIHIPLPCPANRANLALLPALLDQEIAAVSGRPTVVTTSVSAGGEGDVRFVKVDHGVRHCIALRAGDDAIASEIRVRLRRSAFGKWIAAVGNARVELAPGIFTEWIPVNLPGKVRPRAGLVRMLLRCADPIELWISPVCPDTAKLASDRRRPGAFGRYLASRIGPTAEANCDWFAGLTALEATAMASMEFDARVARWVHLCRTQPDGLVLGALELPPTERLAETGTGVVGNHGHDLGVKLDALIEATIRQLRKHDLLLLWLTESPPSPRYFIQLNGWLWTKGYLALMPGVEPPAGPELIDWGRTKAFAAGPLGIRLNRAGREPCGIVEAEAAGPLLDKISQELREMTFAAGRRAVADVCVCSELFEGPFADSGPDLLVRFHEGVALSPLSANLRISVPPVEPADPSGIRDWTSAKPMAQSVIASNLPLRSGQVSVEDLSATVLCALGVQPGTDMSGSSLLSRGAH